jgi:hypothetical protein
VRLLRTMPLSSLAKAFLEKELKFLSAKRGQLSKFLELQAPCQLAPYCGSCLTSSFLAVLRAEFRAEFLGGKT